MWGTEPESPGRPSPLPSCASSDDAEILTGDREAKIADALWDFSGSGASAALAASSASPISVTSFDSGVAFVGDGAVISGEPDANPLASRQRSTRFRDLFVETEILHTHLDTLSQVILKLPCLGVCRTPLEKTGDGGSGFPETLQC